MQTDCIYGRGFRVYVSDACLKDFIFKHTNTLLKLGEQGEELVKWTRKQVEDKKLLDPIKEEFFSWSNLTTNWEGLYGMIADVMGEETGICFEYHIPQDGDAIEDEVIILPKCMPWQFNDVEKNLTVESLDKILQKYIDELGGQLVIEDIRLEYWG